MKLFTSKQRDGNKVKAGIEILTSNDDTNIWANANLVTTVTLHSMSLSIAFK